MDRTRFRSPRICELAGFALWPSREDDRNDIGVQPPCAYKSSSDAKSYCC